MGEPEVLQRNAEQAGEWLEELATELGSEDRAYAHRVLRAHLHAIRDRVSVEEIAQLGAQLPQLIRGIYYDGWVPADTPASYRTVDELLTRIADEARLDSAAEASVACLAASRVLRRHVSDGELDDVIAALPATLRPMFARDPSLDRAQPAPAATAEGATGFTRVVCGIDPSPEATEALRQASLLADEDAQIIGVSVWDVAGAAHGSHQSPQLIDFVQGQAAAALAAANEELPRLQTRLVQGLDARGVLDTATSEHADLLAVGSRAHPRLAGIALGSVATAAAHRSSCSTLIARRPEDSGRFPDPIIHAGDGSPDSQLAATIAARIAARYGSTLIALHVDEGPPQRHAVAEEAATPIEAAGVEPVIEVRHGRPHRRIVELVAETRASLVVLGSRGLTGVRALGSVSERVAHQAPCSVLIVRGTEPAQVP